MPTPCPGLFCLHDSSVPNATMSALAQACERADIDFWPLDAAQLNSWQIAPLPPGSLLYGPGVSTTSERLEARLCGPGVATVFDAEYGTLRQVISPSAAFVRHGVPMPRTCLINETRAASLAAMAEHVGGFPAVLRFSGYSGGRGIVRVDSLAGLISAAQHAAARGACPELVEFIPNAISWRVVVIDGEVVAAARGVLPEGDFRSVESDHDGDYLSAAPDDVAAAAMAATQALQVLAAGVDVLEHPAGKPLVLEANTPFYFGHFEARGLRVAEALVAALLRRAGQAPSG